MVENCWEFNKCGKEPGGIKVEEEGECPTASYDKFNEVNKGSNGGRYCWRVPNTLCNVHNGQEIPNWAVKMKDCICCDFFTKVRNEEGEEVQI